MSDGHVPMYAMLDVWSALGGDYNDFTEYYERNGYAETWAALLHYVRIARGQSRCGEYADDIDGPCVLLEHSEMTPHHGFNDVGSSEPLPFVVRSSMTEKHERFSYPNNPCPGKENEHECDLPSNHITRHMCGECGRYFS